jgi:hypothetical protein
MLQKAESNVCFHYLCIIVLSKSVLNQGKKLLIERWHQSHHLGNNLIGKMKCGTHPGWQGQSEILEKVLVHDKDKLT